MSNKTNNQTGTAKAGLKKDQMVVGFQARKPVVLKIQKLTNNTAICLPQHGGNPSKHVVVKQVKDLIEAAEAKRRLANKWFIV